MGGPPIEIGARQISLAPGAEETLPFSFDVPKSDDKPRFYRMEARFGDAVSGAPLLVIQPQHALLPEADVRPPQAADLGFIVTRGFRNVLPNGPGTAEIGAGWAQPR